MLESPSFSKRGEREGVGEGEGKRGVPPLPSPIPTSPWGARGHPCGPSLLSTKAHEGPILPPANSRNSPVLRKIPEPLRTFPISEYSLQNIDLYFSTILRLLVTSVISSGTPNKLRSSKHITHNTYRHRTLSVRTLRVRELCRHD